MGRRKNPETKEEIQAELIYAKDQIRKLKNQEKIYANAYKNEERRQRTRRLCTEAGILERYLPELKEMSEQDAADFIQIAATCPEATEFLRKRGIRQDEKEIIPTMERPLEVPLHPSEDTGKY
ncbi:MAG: DUF3847 domain-containing protein [Clostridiales bacterium]|nr:DUF3847 domain-containing protein [Clostridiales bacterium]